MMVKTIKNISASSFHPQQITTTVFAQQRALCLCAPIRAAGSKRGELGIRNLDV
jgi:hypothetical protein